MSGFASLVTQGAGVYFTHLEMREKWKHDLKTAQSLAKIKAQELKIQNISQVIFESCRNNKLTYINSFLFELGKEGLESIGALPIAYCTCDAAEKIVWEQLNIYRQNAGLLPLPPPLL
jgi:hypothetical protein